MDDSIESATIGRNQAPSTARSIAIIVSLVLISEVVSFEFNMISPALPAIGKHYQGSQIGWVFTAMLIVGGASLPIIGKMGDRFGKRLILLSGTGSLAFGAILCALSWSFPVMIVGRAFQGVGMVALVLTYGLVRDLVPPRLVPIGIGALGTGVGVSAIIGPFIGGWLTETVGFRAPFVVLAVYAMATILLVFAVVPETPVRNPQYINYLSGLSLGVTLGFLIAAVTFAGYRVPLFIVGVLALAVFVISEFRSRSPLVPLRFVRDSGILPILIVAILIGAIFNSNVTFIPQILQSKATDGQGNGLGLSPATYSLYYAVVMGIFGALTGVLIGFLCRKFSPRLSFMVSAIAWCVGAALVATGSINSIPMAIVLGALFGIGTGSYHSSVSNLVVESVHDTDQGLGASLKTTAEQFAGAVATGFLGVLVVNSTVGTDSATGTRVVDMSGFDTIYVIYVVLAALALLVAVFMKNGRQPASGGTRTQSVESSPLKPSPLEPSK
ncbi:MFS transporter [Gordonia neofelifaecis]|uniref:Mfs transporter n=1 Tax=Gordonia neofelifaecis NRRL B-59395 TaxID=644548 RepID=F1YHS9_9ACTN|nr:MFS transporter [Gordonia neofelifaecis]EGD55917.1 mfs transporter [Gordonia neofelifaecis NRRL B-59395]